MVTIKQVADAAGTSFKTVSRVINNDKNVSKATKSKVLKAIKELGYRPNRAAQMMRNQEIGRNRLYRRSSISYPASH